MKGKFITFEGSEGCGKSTQSKLLYQYLEEKGHSVVYLREPGTTAISEKIRDILLDSKNNIAPEAETLLYMASRAQVVKEIIKPALSQGKIVICDRFLDSTIAYQGFGLGMDINFISGIGRFVCKGIKPDLTILLDLPVKKGLRYREDSRDRIEKRPYAYHIRVRKGYLKSAVLEPERIKIVKVAKDKVVTHEKIRELVLKQINEQGTVVKCHFCHPDPERSEGEGSYQRRDSSSSAELALSKANVPQCQNDAKFGVSQQS